MDNSCFVGAPRSHHMDSDRDSRLVFQRRNGATNAPCTGSRQVSHCRWAGGTLTGKDRFRRWGAFVECMSQDALKLNFLSPDVFELKTMEEKISRYLRAKTITPGPAQLKAFAGRYRRRINGNFRIDGRKQWLGLPASTTGWELHIVNGSSCQYFPVCQDLWNCCSYSPFN